MDDHVGLGQRGTAGLVETETVAADVTGYGADLSLHHPGELLAEFGTEAVEAVVLDDLSGEPAAASARRPGRTSTVTSAPGTHRRIRSTRAVPKNPVAPVMKKRFPRRSRSMGIRNVYHRRPNLSTIW